MPDYLARVEQHYQNLFELPVLFYVLQLALYASGSVTAVQLVLAWGFVATRLLHTVIHTTVNRLRWRMLVFSAGALLLMVSWGVFLAHLLSGPALVSGM